MFIRLLFLLSFCISIDSNAQHSPIRRFYPPDEYQSFLQVWDATQDTLQWIHFGTGTGVSSFNGSEWESFHIGDAGRVRSLYSMVTGKVYSSGQYSYGEIKPDSLKRISFQSLKKQTRIDGQINEHISTFSIGDSLFFYGRFGLELLHADSLQFFAFPNRETVAFTLRNNVYVSNDEGIYEFFEGSFELVAADHAIRNDRLTAAVSFDRTNILLGYGESGLFLFDGKNLVPFRTSVDQDIKQGYIYDLIRTDSSHVGVVTIYNGFYLLDHIGDPEWIYNAETGFDKEGMLGAYVDHENNVWLALWGGIEKILTGVPLSLYGNSAGLDAEILHIHTAGDDLFLSNRNRIFKARFLKKNKSYVFDVIDADLSPDTQFLVTVHQETLYLGSSEGLKKWGDNKWEGVHSLPVDAFIRNADDPDDLTYLSGERLVFIKKGKISTIPFPFNNDRFVDGLLYQGELFLRNSLYLYRHDGQDLVKVPVENDSTLRTSINHMGLINGEIWIAAEGPAKNGGLYLYDPSSDLLKKHHKMISLDPDLGRGQLITFDECDNGDIWFFNNLSVSRFTSEGSVEKFPYQLIGDQNAIYDISCGVEDVMFAGIKGLYTLHDPDWRYNSDFRTNITGMYLQGDSLIYGGYGERTEALTLPYNQNAFRLTYAASSYIKAEANQFSVKLEGFDEDWSGWSKEVKKDYTNIPEGSYTFNVRSRNILGKQGSIDTLSFVIKPPWYRTWWAYLMYILTVGGILYTTYRIRVEQLLRLERMRTKIASDLHDEVSATLTGISYFAEAVEKIPDDQQKKRFVSLIRESATDAKEKITDIVWSINPEHDDFTSFLAKCRRYASDLFESKDIAYKIYIPDGYSGTLPMDYRQHFWMIYKEILTNAVRHSGASKIIVRIDIKGKKLSLLVQDDGKGFDTAISKSGNGINNIRRRCGTLEAECVLDSDPEYGTRWHIIMRLR